MIYIAADHRGRKLQNLVCDYLEHKKADYQILGEKYYSRTDSYVDFAKAVSLKVLSAPHTYGILICASGQGVTIAANRYKGIRAGLCPNSEYAKLARSDDNINILCLPTIEFTTDEKNYSTEWQDVIDSFLNTEFKSNPKYSRRVEQLNRIP